MIHIQHQNVKRLPGDLREQLEHWRKEASEYYRLDPKERSQSRFDFVDPNRQELIRKVLFETFHGKCAYTEAALEFEDFVVVRHRPRSGAIDLRNESARDHYWWLAYEWQNLLPVLPQCASTKGHYFPVAGKRAQPGTTLPEVCNIEQDYLPDPTRPQPAQGLTFSDDGLIRTTQANREAALDILALNDERVVAQRAEAISRLSSTWHSQLLLDLGSFLEKRTRHGTPFLELTIQWIERRIVESIADVPPKKLVTTGKRLALFISKLNHRDYPIERLGPLYRAMIDAKPEASKPPSPDTSVLLDAKEPATVKKKASKPPRRRATRGRPTLPLTEVTLTRIEIRNFKRIGSLTIDLPETERSSPDLGTDAPSSQAPSGLMVLGENASGKSSVLQAVAMALEKPDTVQRHPYLTVKKVLRYGTRKGFVKIHVANQQQPLIVRFARDAEQFTFEGPRSELNFFLHAYGPHRLLPENGRQAKRLKKPGALATRNLWDAYTPLIDAERWLMELDPSTFDLFALSLKDLLNLHDEGFVRRKEGRLEFDLGGKELSLEDLSAGYQSVIGTAANIIAGYPVQRTDMRDATGIVMIDEIGAHLHPSWRMRIVNAYRCTFPRMQLLATTHEPLCLRGLRQHEVMVLKRKGRGVTHIEDLPDLESMRIDQILSSPIFGMNSTVDPKVEADFQRYYELLRTLNGRTKPKKLQDEAKKLRRSLYQFGVLGNSRRAQAIYDIIDRDLALQNESSGTIKLSPKTRREVKKLWSTLLEFGI